MKQVFACTPPGQLSERQSFGDCDCLQHLTHF